MRSGTRKNVRTAEFREMFARLPIRVRELAVPIYRMFLVSPSQAPLRHHLLADSDKGRHKLGTYSVTVAAKYRALYVVDGNTNVWYWIGTHNDYENLIGKK